MHETRGKWRASLFSIKPHTILTLAIAISASLFLVSSSLNFTGKAQQRLLSVQSVQTTVSNGANRWNGDTLVTAPQNVFSPPTSQINVSPLFTLYYQRHAKSLGKAVTAAFPMGQGWMQFFTSGVLFLPEATMQRPAAVRATQRRDSEDPLLDLITSGSRDQTTGVVALSPLSTLLTLGSQAPIGGAGSSLTYVDLRRACSPDLMQPAPGKMQRLSAFAKQNIFITEGKRNDEEIGHSIPFSIWRYINQPDVSPDGWLQDQGDPLTEALPFTLTSNGHSSHMLVQVFERNALMLNMDTLSTGDSATPDMLAIGPDYLRTAGLPSISITAQQKVWAQNDVALFNTPAGEQAIAHIGQYFPLTLLGDDSWQNNTLWYHVQWSLPKSTRSGWIEADATTFTAPKKAPVMASVDALSPQLAAYLANFGPYAGMTLYDVTHQRYYTYNSSTQFIVASSIKVPIMLAFFTITEPQGREPYEG